MYCESYQTYNFRKLGVSNPIVGISAQESRMRENLTYGLMRGQGKHVGNNNAPLSYSTVTIDNEKRSNRKRNI